MTIPIVPAVIPTSFQMLRQAFSELAFAPELSIDVVDGDFVPYTSWPYQPAGEPSQLAGLMNSRTVEVDLMVRNQAAAATAWLAAGADMLVFHARGIRPEDLATIAARTQASLGISISNDAPFTDLEPFLEYVDYLQFMGIAEIGVQGQSFDERVLEHMKTAKSRAPHLPITIDGSVNEDTLEQLIAAGADRLIVGSAIVKASNPIGAYQHLREQASSNR